MNGGRDNGDQAVVLLDYPGASNRHHLRNLDYSAASLQLLDAFWDVLEAAAGDVIAVTIRGLQSRGWTPTLVVASCAAQTYVPKLITALAPSAPVGPVVFFEPRNTTPEQLSHEIGALATQYGLDQSEVSAACRRGSDASGTSAALRQLLTTRLVDMGLTRGAPERLDEQAAQIVRYQAGWLQYLVDSLGRNAAPTPPHWVIDNEELRWFNGDAPRRGAGRLLAAGDSNLSLLEQLLLTRGFRDSGLSPQGDGNQCK